MGEDLVYDESKVEMTVSVDRFSEEVFSLPVILQNAPLNSVLKFFPSTVKVIFSAPLNDLKDISPQDFTIGIDYKRLNEDKNQALIELFDAPVRAQNIRWEPKTVEYLIRQ